VLTLLLYGLLAIAVVVALFLLAANFLPAGEQIAPAVRDEPPWMLPAARRLVAEDVAGLRLPVALRGYRFAETDQLLDRLVEELQSRDEEIARLRAGRPARQGAVATDEGRDAGRDGATRLRPPAASSNVWNAEAANCEVANPEVANSAAAGPDAANPDAASPGVTDSDAEARDG
jgi:hypothetical protein